MKADVADFLRDLEAEGQRLAEAQGDEVAIAAAAHRLVEDTPSCKAVAAGLKLSPRDPESDFSASCELYSFARATFQEMIVGVPA